MYNRDRKKSKPSKNNFFFLHLRIYNFKCLQGKISQEPNIFFYVYESTISNACKEKYHKSQTFFFTFMNLQFQMPARKNITRAKHFFLRLRIYNFKCLQGKISQEPNIFFSFTNLQFQMPARKNITRAKHFFFIYKSTISNAL